MSKLSKRNGKYLINNPKLKMGDEMLLEMGEELEVNIEVVDNRKISDEQRRFIFALCREIAYHIGDDPEYIRMLMQNYNANLKEIEIESLSKCSMSYANGLIDTIITFALEKEVPLSKKIIEESEYRFTDGQTYIMALKRICAVCGRRADLHHTTAIGMGANRKKMSHIGLEIIPLCREHHVAAHSDSQFLEKNHLRPIVVDDKMDYFIKNGKIRIHQEEEK